MELVLRDRFYDKTTLWQNRNSIYYAVKHGKILLHKRGEDLIGFATYGFFTEKELELDSWNGDEVYSREEGVLFFPKFQCRAGRREVIKFIRGIQKFMFKHYPDVEIGKGLRVYPNGSTRDEKWHRKIA
jgi:hypothetical protein|tara:strand:+ start:173 stop:559 length:387 start_codon:yes stop_codon:yes gene_type:complete